MWHKMTARILLLLAVLFLAACSSVPITGRSQLDLVPQGELQAASTQQYQEFLQNNPVVTGTAESAMVKRVGERIAQAVEEYLRSQGKAEQAQNFQWEFNLIREDQVNAWAMPGGKVAVYTGLLPVVEDEAGLAVVMGHEIAHVVAGHGEERMSQQLLTQMGGQALSAVLAAQAPGSQELWSKVYGVGANVGVMLPYSRLQEREADRLGMIFMAMAGYDPHAAIGVWQRMAQAGGGSGPQFLSTHPTPQNRIENIREIIPQAMEYYKR